MLSSKQSLFRNSQICHTVSFTCVVKSWLGCRVSAIQASNLLLVTVLSPSMGATWSTSMLTGASLPLLFSVLLPLPSAPSDIQLSPQLAAVCSSF